MKKGHTFFILEGVFILGVIMYLFVFNVPEQIYPLNGMTILEPNFAFEISKGEEVVLSVDSEFSNPVVLNEQTQVNLAPGLYYWKVRNEFRESEVRNFTVQGYAALDIREKQDSYELRNAGNVDLNVTKRNKGITGMILGVDEIKEVEKDNATYEGKQA